MKYESQALPTVSLCFILNFSSPCYYTPDTHRFNCKFICCSSKTNNKQTCWIISILAQEHSKFVVHAWIFGNLQLINVPSYSIPPSLQASNSLHVRYKTHLFLNISPPAFTYKSVWPTYLWMDVRGLPTPCQPSINVPQWQHILQPHTQVKWLVGLQFPIFLTFKYAFLGIF